MKKKLIALLLILAILVLCGCLAKVLLDAPEEAPAPQVTGGEKLTVHFLDVGQADCALLECGGEYMLIDGGNIGDGRMVIAYLQELGVEELKAVVCTHAHEDHVGGLPSVLAVYPVKQVFAPTKTYASKVFDDFLYYTDQQRLTVTIPSPGDEMTLGQAQVTVLGPLKSYAETNDTSIVMKVVFGETSFLFTGDMEVLAENDLLENGTDLKADVLKVGHHGSDTSTGYRFLYEVDPAYAVISVGEGNKYGHPTDITLSRLNDAVCTIFRTDHLGTVVAVSDGKEVTFTWENQKSDPANATQADITYVGNKNSKKFHAPGCASLPSEKNKVEFDTYEEAVEAGFTPCGSCLG